MIVKLKTIKLLSAILLAASLTACSSTDDEDEATKVAELTEINNQFEPKLVWDNSVGDGVADYFSRIKPAVAYDKVFSASREGIVSAFDVKTGKKIWSKDLRDLTGKQGFFTGLFSSKKPVMLNGGPIAGEHKVFIGSENGQIYALDETNGELIWQSKIHGEVIAAPAIDAGILVVNSASGIIQAYDAETGETRWKVEQEVPPLSLRGISAPVAAAGGVLVGSANGNLDVFILEGGQQGWSAQVGEATGSTELERVIDVDSSPVIFGDKIYAIASRGHLISVDLRTGNIVWKRQYSSYRQIALNGNSIFLTDVKGHVYAVDRNNGVEKWSQLALTNRGVTGPVVSGQYLVVGDFEGYLHWLNQETGEIVARTQLDSSGVYATPVVFGENGEFVVTQSRDGDIALYQTPVVTTE
jgi:outer membrane protein assembly factor BamB